MRKPFPTAITVPGTLLGLVLAAIYPWSLLAGAMHLSNGGQTLEEFLTLVSPNLWPVALQCSPTGDVGRLGLLDAVVLAASCRAAGTRVAAGRTAVRVFCASLAHERITHLSPCGWIVAGRGCGDLLGTGDAARRTGRHW